MTIAILADIQLKEEITRKSTKESVDIIWADSLSSLLMVEADAYFDLQFDADPERIAKLRQLNSSTVFVNAVSTTLEQIPFRCIRINAWPGMLQRDLIEIAAEETSVQSAKQVLDVLGWKYIILPDVPGFVTARVIAMIINEAYFTFEAGISSKVDIDIAMKLGTNYPYGPFEWSERIGLVNIVGLLKALAKTDLRYEIAGSLLSQVAESKNITYK